LRSSIVSFLHLFRTFHALLFCGVPLISPMFEGWYVLHRFDVKLFSCSYKVHLPACTSPRFFSPQAMLISLIKFDKCRHSFLLTGWSPFCLPLPAHRSFRHVLCAYLPEPDSSPLLSFAPCPFGYNSSPRTFSVIVRKSFFCLFPSAPCFNALCLSPLDSYPTAKVASCQNGNTGGLNFFRTVPGLTFLHLFPVETPVLPLMILS